MRSAHRSSCVHLYMVAEHTSRADCDIWTLLLWTVLDEVVEYTYQATNHGSGSHDDTGAIYRISHMRMGTTAGATECS